jgi:deoxyribodipyrimidine photo-lyase
VIHPERIREINEKPVRPGRYVLYWMQASQRAECNHALEYSIERANELGLPLLVYFGIADGFPEANLRHYAFMLEGLLETREGLRRRGIKLVARIEDPASGAAALAARAALLVTDRGYLRIQKKWRAGAARLSPCSMMEVESDVVVPVETVSDKEEYAAATLRPKIHRQLEKYLVPLRKRRLERDSLGLRTAGVDLSDVSSLLDRLRLDRSVPRQDFYVGGASRAGKLLRDFTRNKLRHYAEKRNDPSLGLCSDMSPYLHFGQISPLFVALEIQKAKGAGRVAKDAFLEELIVRRELSANFVHFNRHYDSYKCLPVWAAGTLKEHTRDKRPYVYTARQLESAATHDPYWNAAMHEMAVTGKMANYMRMYWGKKILEWSRTPQGAFRTALRLNNRYFIDGRDPNSFAGVGWCFGKHDRPWTERPVFGKVRYMNANGLRRKFDIEKYVEAVEELNRKEN